MDSCASLTCLLSLLCELQATEELSHRDSGRHLRKNDTVALLAGAKVGLASAQDRLTQTCVLPVWGKRNINTGDMN